MAGARVIFVFGSNLLGAHAGGAARDAHRFWGAQSGVYFGPAGESYAIPTVDANGHALPPSEIHTFVEAFLMYARLQRDQTFYVTPIGCGIAGHQAADIAPLFAGAPSNVQLPRGWRALEPPAGSLSVYIAARGEDQQLAAYCRMALVPHGIGSTARWIDQALINETHDEAQMDLDDVRAADALIVIKPRSSHGKTTGGHHVETGIALERGIPIILLGEVENVFHRHEHVAVSAWPVVDWARLATTIRGEVEAAQAAREVAS